MSEQKEPGLVSMRAAEKILQAIYGDDMLGCAVRMETVAAPVQEVLDEEIRRQMLLVQLFVKVLEKIELIATPPEKSDIGDAQQLAALLGERADAVREISGEALAACRKLLEQQQRSMGQASDSE